MVYITWLPPRTGQARGEMQDTAVTEALLPTFIAALIEQGATIVEVRC